MIASTSLLQKVRNVCIAKRNFVVFHCVLYPLRAGGPTPRHKFTSPEDAVLISTALLKYSNKEGCHYHFSHTAVAIKHGDLIILQSPTKKMEVCVSYSVRIAILYHFYFVWSFQFSVCIVRTHSWLVALLFDFYGAHNVLSSDASNLSYMNRDIQINDAFEINLDWRCSNQRCVRY